MQKFDPYINVDPGTMSPYQHGEVYVPDDGTETDLDLGHYERFTNRPLNRDSNFTTGKIYLSVINKERRGEYLGKTVQVIPHVTDEIKAALTKLAGDDVDVVITEIGGTVGDIEGLPFLEAIRQFALESAGELPVHPPDPGALSESRRRAEDQADAALRRTAAADRHPARHPHLPHRTLARRDDREKIALFCNVPVEAVIEEKDKDFTVYEVPMSLVEHGLDELIVAQAGPPGGPLDLERLARHARPPAQPQARGHHRRRGQVHRAPRRLQVDLRVAGPCRHGRSGQRPHPTDPQRGGRARRRRALLAGVDGVLVPGGFGERGIEGKIEAIRYARAAGHPLLRHLPGHAVRGRRVRPQRAGLGRGQLHRVRQETIPTR